MDKRFKTSTNVLFVHCFPALYSSCPCRSAQYHSTQPRYCYPLESTRSVTNQLLEKMSSPIPSPDPKSIAWNQYINTQSFNLTTLSGTQKTFSLTDFDSFDNSHVTEVVMYAFALGFAAMLIIILVPLTPADKRRQPIFLLNIASLFLIVFRSVVAVILCCASYRGFGQQVLGATAGYGPGTWAPSIIAALLFPPFYATVTASLILQVRVVLTVHPKTRRAVTIFLSLAASVLVAFDATYIVYAIWIQYKPNLIIPAWIYKTTRIFFISYVGVACLIFLYKVAVTIRRRVRMGMEIRQFGPLQILFAMFAQCLVVPRNPPSIIAAKILSSFTLSTL